MDKEYISVRDFASRANISKQRVYQLLEKKLKPYCKVIENKKYVDISALNAFQKQKSDINFQSFEQTIENIVEVFNKQLESKDKQISELTNMLKSMQEKQNELINALKSAQALHAGTIKEHIDSKNKKYGFFSIILSKIIKRRQI
jgi:hypothetical protein